jgi:hypothetical protein
MSFEQPAVRVGRRDTSGILGVAVTAQNHPPSESWSKFMFLHQPGLDASNWCAELAIRFGVILRKVWGGSRAWAGTPAVLMSVWRTC